MKTVFNKTMKLKKSQFYIMDFKNTDNAIFAISKNIEEKRFDGIYDLNNIFLLPDFIDDYKHLIKSGFIYIK